jgi:electron transfer flavoprotein beta subunit
MGIPHISMVIRQEITDGKIRCTRTIDGGTMVLETELPALISTQRGLNEPRYASLPGIMKAKKNPSTRVPCRKPEPIRETPW